MDELVLPDLRVLTDAERSCLRRYLRLVIESLGDELHELVLFGSVARGETWPPGMSIRSDVDVLVMTATAVSQALVDELVQATYPLFLECGRPITPQFRTREEVETPPAFRANLARDGISVYRRGQ